MEAQTAVAEGAVGAPRRRRRRPLVIGGAVLAVVAAAVVAGPLGAYDTVPRARPAVVDLDAGDWFDGQQFSTRVDRALLGTRDPATGREADEGEQFLTIAVTLVTTSDRTVSAPYEHLVVRGLELDDDALSIRMLDDGTGAPALQPGLPTSLAYTWTVPDSVSLDGTPLRVGVVDRRPVESQVSSGTTWIDPIVVAEVELPVEEP